MSEFSYAVSKCSAKRKVRVGQLSHQAEQPVNPSVFFESIANFIVSWIALFHLNPSILLGSLPLFAGWSLGGKR